MMGNMTVRLAAGLSALLLITGLGLSAPVFSAEKVVVMTSYPQEVVTQFEAAFEERYPEYRLEVLWRQSRDAIGYLQKPDHGVDVYWTPSRHNFAELRRQGRLRKLDIDFTGLADSIGGYRLSDPERYYATTEIAGFGMAYNHSVLQSRGLDVPGSWEGLVAPGFNGLLALPVPSKVGFAPSLVDTLLQGYGWPAGWALLLRIAANAKLIDSGSTFVTDEVASGRVGVGVTMDFFAASAIAKGVDVEFIYPDLVGYSPAHVAILEAAPNPNGASAFAAFTLSDEGQQLLFHPDIRKLPVKPAVYSEKPEGYFDPFAAAARASYPYDEELGRARQDLVSALFDALITRHHGTLQQLWKLLHEAEKAAPNHPALKEVFSLAASSVLDEKQSADPQVQDVFRNRHRNADDNAKAVELEMQWSHLAAEQYARAEVLARRILAESGKVVP